MSRLIYSAFIVCILFSGICLAAPKPEIVQDFSDWTLDVQFEHPQQVMMKLPGKRAPQRFWYMIITLTNKTKDDVEFYPDGELMTDTFQLIPAGKRTPKVVFEKIKKLYRDSYPFLELLEETENRVLQGVDNTRDIVIIWPDFDEKAKGIDLFIAGLSNETVVVNHPTAKDKDGDPVKIYLRKTLQLSYSIGGDAKFRSDATLVYKGKNWVMR